MKFDPMTGLPIEEPAAQPAKKFDPMTGQPIEVATPVQPVAPLIPVKKKKTGLIIGIVAAAVVAVVGGTCGVLAANGTFDSDEKKLAKATEKTLKDWSLYDALTKPNISGDYTLSINGELSMMGQGGSVNVDYISTSDVKELVASADINVDGERINASGTAYIDKDNVKVQLDQLGGSIFAYNYNEGFTGELAQYIDPSAAAQLKEAFTSLATAEITSSTGIKTLTEQFEKMNLTKAPNANCLVDGQMVSCKGYTGSIDASFMQSMLLANPVYGSYGMDMDVDFSSMPRISVFFYTYKNKLAQIVLTAEGDTVSIDFNGGDYRMQNMSVSVNGEKMMELRGYNADGTDYESVYVEGDEVFTIGYNKKSGRLSVGANADGQPVEIAFILKTSSDSFSLTFDSVNVAGLNVAAMLEQCNLSITMTKGANIRPLKGNEIYINGMSMDEIEMYANDIEDIFE